MKKILIILALLVAGLGVGYYSTYKLEQRQGRLNEREPTHDDCCMDPCDTTIIPVTDSI